MFPRKVRSRHHQRQWALAIGPKKKGRKFVVVALAVAALFWWVLRLRSLGYPAFALSFGVAAFFRDPVRTTPVGPSLIVRPADVTMTITNVPPPRANCGGKRPFRGAGGPRLDFHERVRRAHQRRPIGGSVRRLIYIPGKFLNADLDKASDENERQHILIERTDGVSIGFTQIAGLVARRIRAFCKAR